MSDLRRLIQQDYREAVAFTKMPDDLRRALKTHERIPAFLTNLERELSSHKVTKFLSRTKIKRIVYDLTAMFIKNAERVVNERMMSDAARWAIEKKASERKELETAVDLAEAKAELTGGPVMIEVPV